MLNKIIIGLSSIIAIALTGCNKQEEQKQCNECEICTECEKEEPEPIREETFYLPSKQVDYSNGEISNVYEYTYDEDLHGYEEFYKSYYNDKFVNGLKRIYKFNEDFSKQVVETYECTPNGVDDYNFSFSDRVIYEYFENNSYTVETYQYDIFDEVVEYRGKNGHFYNEFGSEILYYQLNPIDESDDMEIFIYIETIYDECNRPIRENSYEGTLSNKVLEYYEEYQYEGDTGLVTEYIYDEGSKEFVVDCYRDLLFEEFEGISYRYENIRYPDETEGNHNVFGYDVNGTKVLSNIDNVLVEEIKENENFQIVSYKNLDYNGDLTTMDVSYNEKSLISNTSKLIDFQDDHYNVYSYSSYIYNDTKQMIEASSIYIGLRSDDPIVDAVFSKISYSNIESEELLKQMGVHDSMYRRFSDEILVYGIR